MTEEVSSMSNVYMVLVGDEQGKLNWSIVQPVPIGVMLEAAASLDRMARQYTVSPAPMPEEPETE